MAEISPGLRIGNYVLDRMVGAGAFGQVWRATHHIWNDQCVAIKIPTNVDYIRNLRHEGTVIHGLSHPAIVRAIDLDPFSDPAYLITEFVPGSSLRPLIKERGLSPAQATAI